MYLTAAETAGDPVPLRRRGSVFGVPILTVAQKRLKTPYLPRYRTKNREKNSGTLLAETSFSNIKEGGLTRILFPN